MMLWRKRTIFDMVKRIDELKRLQNITLYERELWGEGLVVAGMDEVGRGPFAGPVVACCVIMPTKTLIEGINDSKKISEKKRELLYSKIVESEIAYGVSMVSEKEIDEINILNATKLAFRKAYEAMDRNCDVVLIDAVKDLEIPCRQISIIHGDALSYSIAAASIIAKVERDRFMCEMDEKYPGYGFAKNKGYGTAEHIAAIKKYGPCALHRRTFIKKYI